MINALSSRLERQFFTVKWDKVGICIYSTYISINCRYMYIYMFVYLYFQIYKPYIQRNANFDILDLSLRLNGKIKNSAISEIKGSSSYQFAIPPYFTLMES